MSGSGQQQGGGGVILHPADAPHQHTHLSKDDLAAIVAALPDGDLKTKLQALLDSLT